MLDQPIPDLQHRMPPGYDRPDARGPDIARLNKLRAELLAVAATEMRRAGCHVEDALADWIGALEDMPDLEVAAENEREDVA